ncbi:MAG: hypothetical protein C0424_11985 [Sphingobacteriaceae bacterium]|nr:hypothetical protein [Sphingobacteriaceae bacterium]
MFKKGMWLYAARGLAMGAGLLSQLMLARVGGAEGYGVFSAMMGLILLANGFADFGVPLNGPRFFLAKELQWIAEAQSMRRTFSLLSGFLYLLACWFLYREYAHLLVFGLPLVLFHFMQIDWLLRAQQKHMLSAWRQMLQTALGLLAVASVFFFSLPWWFALVGISLAGPITYFIFWPTGEQWRKPASRWLPKATIMRDQSKVFIGQLAHQATYALPTLLFLPLAGAAANGQLGSHYLLFTSLGGFSLITLDLFMARQNNQMKNYARSMWLVSLPAFLGILLGEWYYPLLFSGRGLSWNQDLLIPLLAVVGVHTARLIYLNSLLFTGAWNTYRNLSLQALGIHLAAWVLMAIFARSSITGPMALYLLVASEGVLLIRLFFHHKRKMRTHV